MINKQNNIQQNIEIGQAFNLANSFVLRQYEDGTTIPRDNAFKSKLRNSVKMYLKLLRDFKDEQNGIDVSGREVSERKAKAMAQECFDSKKTPRTDANKPIIEVI